MVFSSFIFLFYFLPATLLAYFLVPHRLKNLILILASLFFYTWGEPRFVMILLGLCTVDFLAGLAIRHSGPKTARTILTISILISVAALGYFKYANFFIHEVNRAAGLFGFGHIKWHKVVLPIGISFFTFHKISYVVDVFRGVRQPARSPIDFLLYILFFPQLIAGPIIRYHEIEEQLRKRSTRLEDIFEGLIIFSIGLAKKVLIADVAGHTADQVFGLKFGVLAPSHAWLGLVAYTAQIYFDFSGYSDMATGLARVFGFHFPKNFNYPYLARSFTDFWHRWHMSFGRWMREYLYIPLGGNRVSVARQYMNLWIIFLFSGFWHGAEWTFVLWGIWHGLFMTLERLFLGRWLGRLPIVVQTLLTLFLVMLSRVLFRAETIKQAGGYFTRLVSAHDLRNYVPWASVTSRHEVFIIVLAYAICLWPLIPGAEAGLKRLGGRIPVALSTILRGACALVLLLLSVIALAGTDFSPFIYFQF